MGLPGNGKCKDLQGGLLVGGDGTLKDQVWGRWRGRTLKEMPGKGGLSRSVET